MITLCCIHVPGDKEHNWMEDRFIDSYQQYAPGVDHQTLVICQGAEPHENTKLRYRVGFPNVKFFVRSGIGMDIGAYMDAAEAVQTPIMLCCGGSTTVRRGGWMSRMLEAWSRHGPGMYGSLSSYQVRPHFNTTGFWLTPDMLMSYPHPILTTPDRYEFEHGEGALWWRLHQTGIPCKLVTWCGEYDWQEWRKPDNISCRGDQSNCLTWFRLNYVFEHLSQHSLGDRNNLMYLTDAHILDPKFRYPTWEQSLSGG
jgi:hypothetical protein